MWIFGGQTYTDPGRKILYLGDLWRVRCRQLDSKSKCVDDATYMRHARRMKELDQILPDTVNTETEGGTIYGGGLLWLKLDNFIDTVRAQKTSSKKRHELHVNQPQARASASLSYHKSSNGNRRLILFGGFTGAEYLNDLWAWELPDQDDDFEYYRGATLRDWGTFNDDIIQTKNVTSRLSAYYPFRDAVGRWKRLAPAGMRPSARDTHLALTSWSGYMYTILGRAAETFQADSNVVWGFDPSGGANASGMWYNMPRRNNGPAGRMDTCGGIGYGTLGKQLYAFGGWLDSSYDDVYTRTTDELWQFDMSCTPPVVSQVYPTEGQATFQDACPADNPALKPCGFGEDAVGSVVPCVGHFNYEAPFAENPETFLNDFTSKRPPNERLHKYEEAVEIPRGSDYPPLRGAASGTVTHDLPHGNPVLSAGLSPAQYDMANLRNLHNYVPNISSDHEAGFPLIGPAARNTYLVENGPQPSGPARAVLLHDSATSPPSSTPARRLRDCLADGGCVDGDWVNGQGHNCADLRSYNSGDRDWLSVDGYTAEDACCQYCQAPASPPPSALQMRRSAAVRSARSLSILRVLDSRRVSLSARDY